MLKICNVSKRYGDFVALAGVSLDVKKGEFAALLGPSGCGKTTLLRIISGLLEPSGGEIWIGNRKVNRVPAYLRPVNTVFQNFALFPHMKVRDNVAYGPRRKRLSTVEIDKRIEAVLQLVGMQEMAFRYPSQLSGGQQQRVALARAIINEPSVLLLDEPLGSLDLQLRKRMQIELKRLQRHLGMTFVFVTHDQEEALTMADQIVVMNRGKVEQVGSGEEIYKKPQTKFVAEFIGEANFIPCSVTREGPPEFYFENSRSPEYCRHVAMVRPEKIECSLVQPSTHKEAAIVKCRLAEYIFKGLSVSLVCDAANGIQITATPKSPPSADEVKRGKDLWLSWPRSAARVFEES